MNVRFRLSPAIAVALAAFVVLAGFACGRASAYAEYCPTRVQSYAVPDSGASASAPSSLYAYRLAAFGTRSVRGNVTMKTSDGWFTAAFPSVALTQQTLHMRGRTSAYTRSVFWSPVLYVRFPHPVTVQYMYVGDAQSSGDQIFGWDARGDVTCQAPAGIGMSNNPLHINPDTDIDAKHALQAPPGPSAAVAPAAVAGVPGPLDCKEPFLGAVATHYAQPDVPLAMQDDRYRGVVLVEIAVGADDKLDDAWVSSPSGYREFDEAALKAVRKSRYKAGRSFCSAAPGFYLFRLDFNMR